MLDQKIKRLIRHVLDQTLPSLRPMILLSLLVKEWRSSTFISRENLVHVLKVCLVKKGNNVKETEVNWLRTRNLSRQLSRQVERHYFFAEAIRLSFGGSVGSSYHCHTDGPSKFLFQYQMNSTCKNAGNSTPPQGIDTAQRPWNKAIGIWPKERKEGWRRWHFFLL